MFNSNSSSTLGFINLENKKDQLLPILKHYEFFSVVRAIFAINSWRNNRGSQESCLALNFAITSIDCWGEKEISTYSDFYAFFDEIYPILKTSNYDDPVLCDFGEIKLDYENRYYSVITGTGHTACVFAALQYLEPISNYCSMNQITENLLQYSNTMINHLLPSNAQITDGFSNAPKFECPSKNYYLSVIDFFVSETWNSLSKVLFDMLNTNDNILRCHFVSLNDTILPLFNPSLIIDYFTGILSFVPTNVVRHIVKETLEKKIKSIYCYEKDKSTKLFTNFSFLNNQKKIELNSNCFAFVQDDSMIVFLESSDKNQTIKDEIENAFSRNALSIVDLNDRLDEKQYKAYLFDTHFHVSFLLYDNYLNVDETHFSLRQKGDLRVYTAIDLMYMILISDSLNQIIEFDSSDADETQVISFGGASDYYSVFLNEMGYISKGAIEFNSLYFECDSAASLLLTKYLELDKVFPFHVDTCIIPGPEHWEIHTDENGVNHFVPKSRKLSGGSLFVFDNECTIFSCYNFLTILSSGDYEQINISLEFFRGIIERFLIDFHTEISNIDSVSRKFIELRCHSLYEKNEVTNYINIKETQISDNYTLIEYSVDCDKLMSDISAVDNRSVEYSMMLDILESSFGQKEKFDKFKNAVLQKIDKPKTVDATTVKLPYYFNTKSFRIKTEERSTLLARKKLAQIIKSKGITPGVYERKDATAVVRKMQEESIGYFEDMVSHFDKYDLHNKALSIYASEIFAEKMNRRSFDLCTGIDDDNKKDSREKTQQAIEQSKNTQVSILYLIESNLFVTDHEDKKPTDDDISTLLAYAEWIVALQNVSDLCFHTDSKSKLIILDDYRAEVELGEKYLEKYDSCNKRRLLYRSYDAMGDDTIDSKYIDKVACAFKQDTCIDYKLFLSLVDFLSTVGFNSAECPFDEIKENVMRINIETLEEAFNTCSCDTFEICDIKDTINYLSIDTGKLKELKGQTYPILPIWERENRDNRFDVKPLFRIGNDIVFSPIVLHFLKERWISGMMQFIIPYEIGLKNTVKILEEWKQHYENKFSADIDQYFAEKKFEYHKHDIDIRREDRLGNHPNINELGDYDVIGLSTKLKKIFLLECKVLHPIGSVFEHSNKQRRFFFEGKYDEKFQKRIDYFRTIYPSFFTNCGIDIDVKGFEVCPLLVVNKVFDSYYKDVSFPIVTFEELKNIIES